MAACDYCELSELQGGCESVPDEIFDVVAACSHISVETYENHMKLLKETIAIL